jgi:hypothetical protein
MGSQIKSASQEVVFIWLWRVNYTNVRSLVTGPSEAGAWINVRYPVPGAKVRTQINRGGRLLFLSWVSIMDNVRIALSVALFVET